MSDFWLLFAANLAMTAIMALVVALADRWTPVCRYPRLRHALWLLIVAKLLTPGVIQCPILPSVTAEADFQPVPFLVDTLTSSRTRGPQTPPLLRSDGETEREVSSSAEPLRATLNSAVPTVQKSPSVTVLFALMAIVALPAALLLARCLRQTWSIARLVAMAPVADERLDRIATDACRRMGLTTPPQIRLVAGRLMPLLWVHKGRPRIVLPAPLVGRMSDEQLECIVCHELAHFIRRDHWSNAFALAVAAAYWWFPIVWWARRELLASQEECCDELVILTGGISRRRYAETLFKTIEFINDESLLLPTVASGFGKVSTVRRRFAMIASQKISARFSVFSLGFALLIVGAFLSLPVRGQAAKEATDERSAASSGDAPVSQTAAAARSVTVPVVEKIPLKYRTAEVKVDASRHCLFIGQQAAKGHGALRVDLERGVTYKVTAAGQAFMSTQTGMDADPFPGIVFYYSTDEEDCYAIRYVVLKPGDSVTFRTPWLISQDDEVFALAFFLDAWPDSDNHGSYTLKFDRSDDAT